MMTASAAARSSRPPLRTWQGLPVPYITRWNREQDVSRVNLVPGGPDGAVYRDEGPEDRDKFGFLWARMGGDAGDGEPIFTEFHPERQRTVMETGWCQVCTGEASRTRAGVLFLLPHADAADVEDQVTAKPPVCLPCARLTLEKCAHRGRLAAFRVKKAPLWGVEGVQYAVRQAPGTHAIAPIGRYTVAFGARTVGTTAFRARHVLAYQLLRQLRRVTRVDLDAELEAARLL